jgi:hypothetical protein
MSLSHGIKLVRYCRRYKRTIPSYPIERSIEIAEQLNIKHANKDNEPIFTTTDFMITIETEKGLEDVVRTVKIPTLENEICFLPFQLR